MLKQSILFLFLFVFFLSVTVNGSVNNVKIPRVFLKGTGVKDNG